MKRNAPDRNNAADSLQCVAVEVENTVKKCTLIELSLCGVAVFKSRKSNKKERK